MSKEIITEADRRENDPQNSEEKNSSGHSGRKDGRKDGGKVVKEDGREKVDSVGSAGAEGKGKSGKRRNRSRGKKNAEDRRHEEISSEKINEESNHDGKSSRNEGHEGGQRDGKSGKSKSREGGQHDGKNSKGKSREGGQHDAKNSKSGGKNGKGKSREDGRHGGKNGKEKGREDGQHARHSNHGHSHTEMKSDDLLFGGFFGEENLFRDPTDSDIYEEFNGMTCDEAYSEYMQQATKEYDATNGTLVAGVKFKTAGKVYFFDPEGFDLSQGDNVIVETARGLEFGELASDPYYVSEKSIVKPLKKVIRVATEEDRNKHNANIERKKRAVELCQKKVTARNLDMKLIDVEYTFDDSKIIFYFTADGRVDFRELVKDLAGVFRMRIELRQIGVRDEAKMIGGIGTCGRGLCCHSWLPDFQPVSIKMAKTQGLSLNPAKISGICGRLMCCLKYENDVYNILKQGMPDQGEKVATQDGMAVVVSTNILREQVKVRHLLDDIDEETGEPKLSQDITTYTKQDIKRLGKKKHQKNAHKEKDENPEDLPDDVKSLLDD